MNAVNPKIEGVYDLGALKLGRLKLQKTYFCKTLCHDDKVDPKGTSSGRRVNGDSLVRAFHNHNPAMTNFQNL